MALAVGVALVACTGVPTATAPSGEPTVAASEAPVSTRAIATPEPLELGEPAPIKVGIIEPLTGNRAVHGVDNTDGFNLYLASVNHTIADRKIEPIVADSEGNAATALAKVKDLAEGQHVS
ncbi:MAG: ABC transporter substrate-binding protein, partial [Chloroflexota bacterium]